MRPLLALVAAAAFAGCAHGGEPASSQPTDLPATRGVGFVRMDDLLKHHPLYAELERYETSMRALNLRGMIPQALAASPDLQRRKAELERELEAAAKRTNQVLQQKSGDYSARENAAIDAALRGASAGGPGAAGIAAGVEETARGQTSAVAVAAQRALDAFRRQLQAEDEAQIGALQDTLGARAERTYRAKADELAAREAALTLKLASEDAPERLSLRTKLTSLALEEPVRAEAQARLATLDRREADAIAAQRNLDGQTLAALQAELRTGVQTEVQQRVGEVRTQTLARLRAREAELRKQFASPAGPVVSSVTQNGKPIARVDPKLPPALRERIGRLHEEYTKAFQADARTTIADFNRTRDDLEKRFAALAGMGDESTRSAQAEIASLQKKHDSLYDQMIAQIGREVKIVAQRRGISVVLTNVAARAGGVDLTDDAMKDIETLHE